MCLWFLPSWMDFKSYLISFSIPHTQFLFPYLNQEMLWFGSSLAVTHQLFLTLPVGEENSSQSVKPSHCNEMSCCCMATQRHGCPPLAQLDNTEPTLQVAATLSDAKQNSMNRDKKGEHMLMLLKSFFYSVFNFL